MENLLYKSQNVEVTVSSSGGMSSNPIKDQPNLDNSQIMGLRVYPPAYLPNAINTGGVALTLADLKKCVFVLQFRGTQVIQRIPVLDFCNVVDATSPYYNIPVKIDGWVLDWSKCSIDTNAGITTTGIVSFAVYYDDRVALGDPMQAVLQQIANRTSGR